MIILNTTFVIEPSLRNDVLDWIKHTYIASAIHSNALENRIVITKVLNLPEDESESYAVHLWFESLNMANDWNNRLGARLRTILSERWGQEVLAFHTFLEVIE